MSLITSTEKQKIKEGWAKGLTRASFGGGRGTCQLTGSRDGSVVLYVYGDKRSFTMDFRDDATPFLFSINAYKDLKKELDSEFPEASAIRESLLKKPPVKANVKAQSRPSKRVIKEKESAMIN